MEINPIDEIEVANSFATVARLLRGYYLNLLEQGFEPIEALRLVVAAQASFFTATREDD